MNEADGIVTTTEPAPLRIGTTAAAVQAEGVHPAADWSVWERERKAPRSGDGNGFLTNFHDDLALIASLGLTEVRLTLEWARIEPTKDKVDAESLDRYDDIVGAAVAVGLRPWLTLAHTSLPGWFADDEGGFADERGRDYLWLRHVDRIAERFGDVAAGFTPIEDPVGWAVRGFALGSRPPGRRRDTELGAIEFHTAVEAALLADHLAARHLKAGGAVTMASRGTPTMFPVVDDPQSRLEADAARNKARDWGRLLFDTWVAMSANGELVVPGRRPLQDVQWVDDFDVLGVGFDAPVGVDARGGLRPYPANAPRTDAGFTPLAEELGVQLRRLDERLPRRTLALSSHGMSTADDGWRTDVLGQTIDEIEAARADGVSVDSLFIDTAIDGYEWRNGFETQRGLIDRDRAVKGSGEFLRERLGGI